VPRSAERRLQDGRQAQMLSEVPRSSSPLRPPQPPLPIRPATPPALPARRRSPSDPRPPAARPSRALRSPNPPRHTTAAPRPVAQPATGAGNTACIATPPPHRPAACSTAAIPAPPSQPDVHHRQPERPNSILHLSHRAAIQPPAAAAGPLSALPRPIRIGPACHTGPRRRQGCSIVFHDHAHRRLVPGNRSSCQSHLRDFRRRAVSPQLARGERAGVRAVCGV
jgi:hypothetical protein